MKDKLEDPAFDAELTKAVKTPFVNSKKKKIEMAKKIKSEGFDSNKRWGNSGTKGHGVNSPAMMQARKKFDSK